MDDATREQPEVVKSGGKFWPILWVVTVLLMSMCLWWSSWPDIDENHYHESYGPISIGDSIAVVEAMVADDRYQLVGVFEYENEQPIWRNLWLDETSRVTTLQKADLVQNKFWGNLGWTYPKHALTQKATVVYDTDIWSTTYVYIYLDKDGNIVGTYVGYT